MGADQSKAGRFFADSGALLDAAETEDILRALARSADIVLIIGPDGVIRDFAVAAGVCASEVHESWAGRQFSEILTVETVEKGRRLLTLGDNVARQVNHPTGGSEDLAVEYRASSLADGHRILFGRDLSALSRLQRQLVEAQLAHGNESDRIRGIEAQYRALFETAKDTLLLVNPSDRTIVEANGVALASHGGDLIGASLDSLFARDSLEDLDTLVISAFNSGRTVKGRLGLANGEGDASVSLRFFRRDGGPRLSVGIGGERVGSSVDYLQELVGLHWQMSADSTLLLDADARIIGCNRSTLSLLQVNSMARIADHDAHEFVGGSEEMFRPIRRALERDGVVNQIETDLLTPDGVRIPVDISGTRVLRDQQIYYGLNLRRRRVGSAMAGPSAETAEIPQLRPADEMVGLIGTMPLREIVGETAEIIEQLCIEAALDLTGDNKASAAELLGLSRQALYTKLRRYGIHGVDAG